MALEIDLHGLTEAEARRQLEKLLGRLPSGAGELTVIHGHSSTVLRDMVRLRLKHRRIAAKRVGLNPGVTVLVLK